MKINSSSTTKTSSGVKSTGFSIKLENAAHIMNMVSASMYQRPKRAVIREIVSNGLDSHKRSGVDTPVLVSIGQDSVDIQDWGLGLSQQDFEDIYLSVGESDKRDSDEEIGGFGLGRLSVMAACDVATITYIKDGQKNISTLQMDGNTPQTSHILCTNTDEENGVTVSVPISNGEHNQWKKACEQELCFFKGVKVVSDVIIVDYINEAHFVDFNTFQVSSLLEKAGFGFVMGGVFYETDLQEHRSELIYPGILNNDLAVKLNIGDITPHPSRESFILSSTTTKFLIEKINEVCLEIEALLEKEVNGNFTTFKEYYDSINNIPHIKVAQRVLSFPSFVPSNRTFNCVKYDEKMVKTLWNRARGITISDRVWEATPTHVKKMKWKTISLADFDTINFRGNVNKLTPLEKSWLRTQGWKTKVVDIPITLNCVKSFIRKLNKGIVVDGQPERKIVLQEVGRLIETLPPLVADRQWINDEKQRRKDGRSYGLGKGYWSGKVKLYPQTGKGI